MDFLSCVSSACLPVMGCSDLTLQNAADCGGISSSLCLSIAERSANDLLMFASRWMWRISNNGVCCSLQVYDLYKFLFYSRKVLVFLVAFFYFWVQTCVVAALYLTTCEICGKFIWERKSGRGVLELWDNKQHDGSLLFFPVGEDVVAAGFVPACPLLGSAIGAHVLSHNQDRPSSRLWQQPHPAQLRRGRHWRGRGRRPGDVCSWVRKGGGRLCKTILLLKV